MVRCAFGGRVYSRCVYIWVDSDVALVRGLVQGYPKKLGSIHQTRPHPFGRAAPRIAPGGTFAGTLSAGGRRLAQAVVTLREEAPAPGFVNAHPMAHHRWMPSIEKGAPDALAELVASGSASVEGGPSWRGDATLELFESPTEELASSRSGRSSAATTGRSASAGTAAPSLTHIRTVHKVWSQTNLPGGLPRDGTSAAGRARRGGGGRRTAWAAASGTGGGGRHGRRTA